MYCDKTKWCTTDILIPHETAITLLFWHQHCFVGDAPFPVKYLPKVTHPRAKLILPCDQYFICIREMVLLSRYFCLANSSASRPAQNHWQCWQLHNGLFGLRQLHGLSAIAELLVTWLYTWWIYDNELAHALYCLQVTPINHWQVSSVIDKMHWCHWIHCPWSPSTHHHVIDQVTFGMWGRVDVPSRAMSRRSNSLTLLDFTTTICI